MATYAIGDVQGCHREMVALLDQCGYRRGRDRLWFAGDLVNRGPDSLSVLRFVRDLGDDAVTVLGNHDLHLLATASGGRKLKRSDTFADVLDAPDRDELLDWLQRRPMIHRDETSGLTLVHAGLPPQWDCAEAAVHAAELERALRGGDNGRFFSAMYGNEPACWSPELTGKARLRFITNALTRMRYVSADGHIDLDESGPPGSQPDGLVPWFELPERRSRGEPILFGHWATLEIERPVDPGHGVEPLDSGCVWGGSLRALRIEDRTRFSVPGPR